MMRFGHEQKDRNFSDDNFKDGDPLQRPLMFSFNSCVMFLNIATIFCFASFTDHFHSCRIPWVIMVFFSSERIY